MPELIAGLLLAAVPLAFGVLRALTTGSDFRYLVVAFVSTLTAALILGAAGRRTSPSLGRGLAAVLIAAGAASGTAFAQGAASLAAVLVVAVGFAICSGIGCALIMRSRSGSG